MITPAAIASTENTNSYAARIGWAVLICATLYVCYFSHLGAIGFVGPDEPRYAWIARDMVETGDWVTPRLYGKPWFEKPPLYYWGAAICFKLFGVSEVAARLPSAISALLATLAMAWLAWRVYGPETARWLLLLLPTTVGMIGFSHAAATDMPFSAMVTIAIVCAAVLVGLVSDESCRDGAQHSLDPARDKAALIPGDGAVARRRWLALILFGLFIGLAVLAKGPATIILCGGTLFFWALFTKRWRDALRLLHPAAIATLCATALPWYILCARRNPDFFRIFIIEHNFKRFLTPEFQHIQPFWFYVPIFLVGIFPWLFWISGIFSRGPENTKNREINFLALSWALLPILFFSVSQSKLPGYILPSIPPAIFLVARTIEMLPRSGSRAVPFAAALTGLILVCAAAWMFLSLTIAPTHSWPHELMIPWMSVPLYIMVTGVGGLLAIGLAAYGRVHESQLIAVGAIVFILFHAENSLLPKINPIVSPRLLAQQIRSSKPDAVYTLGIQRGWRYGLSFYLNREISDLPETISERALVVVDPKIFHSLEQRVSIERVDSTLWPQAQIVAIKPLPANTPRSGKSQ